MAMHEQHQLESNKLQSLENLDQLLKPLLVLSRAVGVFPFSSVNNGRVVRWWRNWWNLSSAFFICSACYILFKITRDMLVTGVLKVYNGASYLSIIAFYLHVILSAASFIYVLNWKPYLNDLCRVWSSLQFGQNTTAKLNADLKRKVKCNLGLTVLACIIYISTLIGNFMTYGFHEDEDILLGVFLVWYYIAIAIQLGLFCTVCFTSSCLLTSICQDIERKLDEDGMEIHLKWFRDVFMTVVDFVEVSNRLFGQYVGFLVTFFLIETCCNTYLFFPYKIVGIIPMICDLVFAAEGLVLIIIVCLSAGEIAEQAGRPFRVLLKFKVSESPSIKQFQELMLMLDCSKHVEVKIFMFGIMPITKESLPVIFGIYLSYVFLLYQFPQGLDNVSTCQTATNCTAATTNFTDSV